MISQWWGVRLARFRMNGGQIKEVVSLGFPTLGENDNGDTGLGENCHSPTLAFRKIVIPRQLAFGDGWFLKNWYLWKLAPGAVGSQRIGLGRAWPWTHLAPRSPGLESSGIPRYSHSVCWLNWLAEGSTRDSPGAINVLPVGVPSPIWESKRSWKTTRIRRWIGSWNGIDSAAVKIIISVGGVLQIDKDSLK
jgi:hypothetical protein